MKLPAAMLALLCSAAASAALSQAQIEAYRALVEQDSRLANISYRLVTANARFCEKRERNPGWVLHDEWQYPDRQTARAAFGFRRPVAVSAVVENGEGKRLGIVAGDGLVALNGKNWVWNESLGQNARRIETVQEELRNALASGAPVQLTLATSAGLKSVRIDPPATCASRFWVDANARLDAGADGTGVRVSTGLIDFIGPDDAELAAAVAHELSHNLLDHSNRLSGKRRTRDVLATEIEADRLSVWLMANAGYDPKAALRFAERYGRKTGLGIFSDGTHLRWKNRVKVMKAEIDLLATTARQDGLLPPPLLIDGE